MSKNLVIVESPAKAKTIKKYLGKDFEVMASYGHVRDLVPKEGAVDPTRQFAMRWELIDKNRKHVDAIARAVRKADALYLSTDPDREGEAISWHLYELLKDSGALDGKAVHRSVFYEITKHAVQEAVDHPREIAEELVKAYLARRALDYLVGFNLSPLLWKKAGLSGASAGRVQSPALRMICEREDEILAFVPREYWTVEAEAEKDTQPFAARLTELGGEKVEQFTITDGERAGQVRRTLEIAAGGALTVANVEKKQRKRNPSPPFTTSTLQQEASRKLGFGAQRTMRTAQRLYEGVDFGEGPVGLITYMRTDSVSLAGEAIADLRRTIAQIYGADAVPAAPRQYRTKSKNAQEAHEGIRPTAASRTPEQLAGRLDPDQHRLYTLIWRRAVASQMEAAVFDTVAVDLSAGAGNTFRANGSTLVSPGFLAVYRESFDDVTLDDEDDRRLPALETGDRVKLLTIKPEQHFTEPPPRYSEASLVKALEEYGIGRPSTYASIISTLQDRGYAVLDKKRFVPTDIGRLVNGFLTAHFDPYIEYGFTARMEDQLDFISNGEREWVPVLAEFWDAFSHTLEDKQGVPRGSPLNEPCPKCGSTLFLQNSKRGLFVGCSAYPKCDYTRPWGALPEGPINLGQDPSTGLDVLLQRGPYGYYAQLGPTVEGAPTKPRRASWPKNLPVATADLETALKVLSLPRVLGNHPDTGKPVEANVGRFGPYVKHDGAFKSIPKAESVYDITLERAVQLLAAPKSGHPSAAPGKELGLHPIDNKPVVLMTGKYGPYVKHGNVNATVPSDMNAQEITLDDAVDLLAERAARELAKSGSTARPMVTTMRAAAASRPGRKAGAGPGVAAARPAAGRPGSSGKGRAPAPQSRSGRPGPGGAKPGGNRAAGERSGSQPSGAPSARRRGAR
jgi:DNA topoisomerase-1